MEGVVHTHSALSGILAAKGSSFAGGLVSGLLSFVITETTTGNLFIALAVSATSSAIVAWFTNRPKYISAVSAAKISESELLGKQTAALIERLNKDAQDNSQIAALQVSARHKLQGYYQAAISYIDLLQIIMQEHSLHVPEFKRADVSELLEQLDKEINKIKGDRQHHDANH